jgi:glycosyltransferase involved in cell wall biosynthesis
LTRNQFNYVHAIEIQGAGYILSKLDSELFKFSKVILTNWGSDIYYFKSFPYHLAKIKEILQIADYYSAECLRDYSLARELGFSGIELPCIPNAGGFDVLDLLNGNTPPSSRSQILIKGYGGQFGRADMPISLIPLLSKKFPNFTYYIYSVTPDTLALIKKLPKEIQRKIRISKVRRALSQKAIFEKFKESRIYIGCSESDGISTSFLEALISGAYPIQTGTSCANEWVQKGASASIVRLDSGELQAAIENSLSDDQLVDRAAAMNRLLAEVELSAQVIKRQALTFYSV